MDAPLSELIRQAGLFAQDYGWLSAGLIQRRMRVDAPTSRFLFHVMQERQVVNNEGKLIQSESGNAHS